MKALIDEWTYEWKYIISFFYLGAFEKYQLHYSIPRFWLNYLQRGLIISILKKLPGDSLKQNCSKKLNLLI